MFMSKKIQKPAKARKPSRKQSTAGFVFDTIIRALDGWKPSARESQSKL